MLTNDKYEAIREWASSPENEFLVAHNKKLMDLCIELVDNYRVLEASMKSKTLVEAKDMSTNDKSDEFNKIRNSSAEYVGHITHEDGTIQHLSSEEAKALWEEMEQSEKRRAKLFPDTFAVLNALMEAQERLRELGWRSGTSCPRDGSCFAVIMSGSTGIFSGNFLKTDFGSRVMIVDYLHPLDSIFWKAISKLTDAERERMNQCMESEYRYTSRMIKSLIAFTEQEDNNNGN